MYQALAFTQLLLLLLLHVNSAMLECRPPITTCCTLECLRTTCQQTTRSISNSGAHCKLQKHAVEIRLQASVFCRQRVHRAAAAAAPVA